MTNLHLLLKAVSCTLPDGRTLFCDINEQFDLRPTGLVGRNGAGKTLLARILAGQLPPTTGHRQCSGSVHYLAQQVVPPKGATVADLAGVRQGLDALTRIESGSTELEDFDAVGDRWDLRHRLRQELEHIGLGRLEADIPPRVLLLDEPNNHLDLPSARALESMLCSYQGTLVVVSHDDAFLANLELTHHLLASDEGWRLRPA